MGLWESGPEQQAVGAGGWRPSSAEGRTSVSREEQEEAAWIPRSWGCAADSCLPTLHPRPRTVGSAVCWRPWAPVPPPPPSPPFLPSLPFLPSPCHFISLLPPSPLLLLRGRATSVPQGSLASVRCSECWPLCSHSPFFSVCRTRLEPGSWHISVERKEVQ